MRTRRRLAPLVVACLTGTAVAALLAAGPAVAAEKDGDAAPERLAGGTVVDASAPELPTDLTAASWVVADLDTGEVLAAKDAHAPHAPASTLKVLTAVSLLPAVPPSAVVTPTQAEVEVEGSKVGLLRDVAYPAEELYASLLMVSGNDAANALAGAAGGQVAAAALMNAKARELGAVDTRAVNPHGLDADGQVSTAYDLAAIGRAALDVPDIARWVATRKATMAAGPGQPRFEIYNKNKLLGSYEGALGVKNGYTVASRASFIGAAERDGHRLVVALMRAEPRVWAEAGRLLDWGFAATESDVEPVGDLPAPLEEPAAENADEESSGTTTVDLTPTSGGSEAAEGSSLPEVPGPQLGAVLLVAGAVLAVRPSRRRATTL
jgi:D-alanyl-D-alanine carboxypeptidase (penicillin-binding protein 5/6)